MSAARRKVIGARLLIVGANLASIVVIVKLASVSPIRAFVVVVACVLVQLVLWRREVTGFIHRTTGHWAGR